MKKNNHSRQFNSDFYKSFDMDDTRYYGVRLKGQGDGRYVLVDLKRFQKVATPSDMVIAGMSKRKGPFFKPAKRKYLDYYTNFVSQWLREIQEDWEKDTKPMINRVLAETKGKDFIPADCEALQYGIAEYDEASTWATMQSWKSHYRAAVKKNKLYCGLYAQFFHQMVSTTEALCVTILTKGGWEGDHFDRNVFYAFKGAKQEQIKSLDGHTEYDKMYAVWNFLKHNSKSTYDTLHSNYPDLLNDGQYSQGMLGCYFVKLSDELIDSLFDGVKRFLKEYCRVVFEEDTETALWNCDEYFMDCVNEMRDIGNMV